MFVFENLQHKYIDKLFCLQNKIIFQKQLHEQLLHLKVGLFQEFLIKLPGVKIKNSIAPDIATATHIFFII